MWPGLGSIAQHGVVERSIVVEIDGYHSAGKLHRVCLKKLALQGNSIWHCELTFCLYPKTQAVFWRWAKLESRSLKLWPLSERRCMISTLFPEVDDACGH